MNYFAHALPLLDEPYVVAGTSTPDWLSVVDRRVRVRARRAQPWVDAECPHTSAVARGILQHLRDDFRFHETRAFVETSMELSTAVRRVAGAEPDYRASFVGHVLVEVLLDAALAEENPGGLEAYYRALAAVEPEKIQEIVNRIALVPTERLAPFVVLFCRERILWDYFDDQRLLVRLNQVMRRIGFPQLPEEFAAILPEARSLVRRRRLELLDGIPVPMDLTPHLSS